MSVRGRHSADEVIALTLARGRTMEDAARESKVSVRTVQRRLSDPAFASRVAELRSELVSQTVGQLAAQGAAAVKALTDLVAGADGKLKLGAARAILTHLLGAGEQSPLAEELRALRKELEDMRRVVGVDAKRGAGAADPGGSDDASLQGDPLASDLADDPGGPDLDDEDGGDASGPLAGGLAPLLD